MSDKGLCPLPSPFDTAQIGIVKACLSSSFTRFRCDFKKKVTLSLQPGSDLENVGTLALALLGESESQFTISFAWRLALVVRSQSMDTQPTDLNMPAWFWRCRSG
jgi:hypothetical protein